MLRLGQITGPSAVTSYLGEAHQEIGPGWYLTVDRLIPGSKPRYDIKMTEDMNPNLFHLAANVSSHIHRLYV